MCQKLLEEWKLDYRRDLPVDKSKLDEEWLKQSQLVLDYGEVLAIVRRNKIDQERRVKSLIYNRSLMARQHPVDCGLRDKPTIKEIEMYAESGEEYIKEIEILDGLDDDYRWMELVFKEISSTRKAVMENLGRLYGMEYFSQ